MSIRNQDYLKLIGANLKKIRESKSLSLRQLSRLSNVDHSDIAKIEKGRVNISVSRLAHLAEVLEVLPARIIEVESLPNSSLLLPADESSIPDHFSDIFPGVEITTDILQRILKCMEDFPPERRKIFKMICLEGLSVFEVAGTLGLPVDTVRVQKAIALQILRNSIGK